MLIIDSFRMYGSMAGCKDEDYVPSDFSTSSSSSYEANGNFSEDFLKFRTSIRDDINDVNEELLDVREVILGLDEDISKSRELILKDSSSKIIIIINLTQEDVMIIFATIMILFLIYFISS